VVAGGVTSNRTVEPAAPSTARTVNAPSALVVASVEGTPSIVSCTLAPAITTFAGSRTTPVIGTPETIARSVWEGIQFLTNWGAKPAAVGTTSTSCGWFSTRAENAPLPSENDSTNASLPDCGRNRRYDGIPVVPARTAPVTTTPGSSTTSASAVGPPPFTITRLSTGGPWSLAAGTTWSRISRSFAPGTTEVTIAWASGQNRPPGTSTFR
jgi:hypothetical protein